LKNNLIVRKEQAGDKDQIYFVNDQAFERNDEADLVDELRERNKLLLSLVAEIDKKVVGYIAFTRVFIQSASAAPAPVGAGLAPMAVLKEYQNRKIGSALVTEGLRQCEEMGIDYVTVLGYPGYYPRFGFQKAAALDIHCQYNVPEEMFMVIELGKGKLKQIANHVINYDPIFDGK
jgi:putative acetyltransferase